MKVAEETERDIDATRLEYVPVAVRTQILFFCVSDLSNVDPMYQYSLEWFLGTFVLGIFKSKRAGTVPSRALPTHATPSYIVHSLLLHRTLCSHTSPADITLYLNADTPLYANWVVELWPSSFTKNNKGSAYTKVPT